MGKGSRLDVRLALASVGLALALLAACKGEEEAEKVASVASPTVAVSPTPPPTPPSTPTPISTPKPLLPLEAALADTELLALRPIVAPNLVYAVKNGKHVTVFMRNIETGQEELLTEYDERVEAKHSGNLWQELPPSVALSPAEPVLVYSEERDILTYHIDDKITKTLLRQGEGMGSGELIRYAWSSDSGAELCCAFGLASPVVSRDGTSVVLPMTQYEGGTLGVFRLDGAAACVVTQADAQPPASLRPVWNPKTGDLLIPSGDIYAADGLFVAPMATPCSGQQVAPGLPEVPSKFAADWSPDGEWIVASLRDIYPATHATLLLMRRDGSESRTLVEEGFNLWPLFSVSGDSIYVVRRAQWFSTELEVTESLWRYDLASGEMTSTVDIPVGWSVQPKGFTSDGYLILDAHSSRCFRSCENRLLLLDVATGGVAYASAATDFTRYLGFLP